MRDVTYSAAYKQKQHSGQQSAARRPPFAVRHQPCRTVGRRPLCSVRGRWSIIGGRRSMVDGGRSSGWAGLRDLAYSAAHQQKQRAVVNSSSIQAPAVRRRPSILPSGRTAVLELCRRPAVGDRRGKSRQLSSEQARATALIPPHMLEPSSKAASNPPLAVRRPSSAFGFAEQGQNSGSAANDRARWSIVAGRCRMVDDRRSIRERAGG